jgi:hypothetical protein
MSGEWIPMRLDLDEDPAVIGVAAKLGLAECYVVGLLWKLWSIASRQTSSGFLPNYTLSTIDRLVAQPGFADALEAVEWLQTRGNGIQIPHFEHWLSRSAKVRKTNTLRQRLSRLERDTSATDARQKRDHTNTNTENNNPPQPPPKRGGRGRAQKLPSERIEELRRRGKE